MGGSGSKVTCDNERMQKLFGELPCTEEQVQIANDLWNYYHLAGKRWVGDYPRLKSGTCKGSKTLENNPDYTKERLALEKALLDKLTAFFSKYNPEQIGTYKNKFERIENVIIADLKLDPRLPFFCRYNNKLTRDGSSPTDSVGLSRRESYMFDIETKQKQIQKIVNQAILGEVQEEETKRNGVQPNLKF